MGYAATHRLLFGLELGACVAACATDPQCDAFEFQCNSTVAPISGQSKCEIKSGVTQASFCKSDKHALL